MVTAIVDFEIEGKQIKSGQEITPETFSADVLLGDLWNAGLVRIVFDPVDPEEKHGKRKK